MNRFNNVLGVIPARYGSTRLRGKPLVKICGRPLIYWVYKRAEKVLKNLIVATDDGRVVEAVTQFGGKACLTSIRCRNGTERVTEVAKRIKAAYYVNIQGDEPLIHPQTIRGAIHLAMVKKAISTPAVPLKASEKKDPHAVKVVIGKDQRALYFSRSMIPFEAHGIRGPAKAYKHLGLYVYPRADLFKFSMLIPTELEKSEKLEQLRALYYGLPIYVQKVSHDSIGVDTPQDLRIVKRKLIKK